MNSPSIDERVIQSIWVLCLTNLRFMRQRPLVDWAVSWMEQYRNFREGEA